MKENHINSKIRKRYFKVFLEEEGHCSQNFMGLQDYKEKKRSFSLGQRTDLITCNRVSRAMPQWGY